MSGYDDATFVLTGGRFRDASQAKEALEKMNGFDLAGRPIRVGLGNDKFTPETTANLLERFQDDDEGPSRYQGSRDRRGSGYERAGEGKNDRTRDDAKAGGLDDAGGVNYNNYNRNSLMRKLARSEDAGKSETKVSASKAKSESKPLPVSVSQASRCVLLRNMFNPAE